MINNNDLKEKMKNLGIKPIGECEGLTEQEKTVSFMRQLDKNIDAKQKEVNDFVDSLINKYGDGIGVGANMLCLLSMKIAGESFRYLEKNVINKAKEAGENVSFGAEVGTELFIATSLNSACETGIEAAMADRTFEKIPFPGESN